MGKMVDFYGLMRNTLHGWPHRHNLANNILGAGGGGNRPWVLETLIYGVKLKRRGRVV
jgi:hypothetical protein